MTNGATIAREQLHIVLTSPKLGDSTRDLNRFACAGKGNSTYSFGLLRPVHGYLSLARSPQDVAHKMKKLACKMNNFVAGKNLSGVRAKRIAALLVAALLMNGTVRAQSASAPDETSTDGIRASYFACLKVADGVMPDMQECIGTEYDYQDKRLNQVYKALMARLSKTEQIKLRAEERKWIAHRDAYCALPPDAGQGQRLESNGCTMEQTAKRAATLEARTTGN